MRTQEDIHPLCRARRSLLHFFLRATFLDRFAATFLCGAVFARRLAAFFLPAFFLPACFATLPPDFFAATLTRFVAFGRAN